MKTEQLLLEAKKLDGWTKEGIDYSSHRIRRFCMEHNLTECPITAVYNHKKISEPIDVGQPNFAGNFLGIKGIRLKYIVSAADNEDNTIKNKKILKIRKQMKEILLGVIE